MTKTGVVEGETETPRDEKQASDARQTSGDDLLSRAADASRDQKLAKPQTK